MPSDKSTVATKADFVPKVVGKTDRDRSFSSVLAHDERTRGMLVHITASARMGNFVCL